MRFPSSTERVYFGRCDPRSRSYPWEIQRWGGEQCLVLPPTSAEADAEAPPLSMNSWPQEMELRTFFRSSPKLSFRPPQGWPPPCPSRGPRQRKPFAAKGPGSASFEFPVHVGRLGTLGRSQNMKPRVPRDLQKLKWRTPSSNAAHALFENFVDSNPRT